MATGRVFPPVRRTYSRGPRSASKKKCEEDGVRGNRSRSQKISQDNSQVGCTSMKKNSNEVKFVSSNFENRRKNTTLTVGSRKKKIKKFDDSSIENGRKSTLGISEAEISKCFNPSILVERLKPQNNFSRKIPLTKKLQREATPFRKAVKSLKEIPNQRSSLVQSNLVKLKQVILQTKNENEKAPYEKRTEEMTFPHQPTQVSKYEKLEGRTGPMNSTRLNEFNAVSPKDIIPDISPIHITEETVETFRGYISININSNEQTALDVPAPHHNCMPVKSSTPKGNTGMSKYFISPITPPSLTSKINSGNIFQRETPSSELYEIHTCSVSETDLILQPENLESLPKTAANLGNEHLKTLQNDTPLCFLTHLPDIPQKSAKVLRMTNPNISLEEILSAPNDVLTEFF